MGLNRALQERVESMEITDPLTRRIHLKMSGCPNGCGQHHIGTIGFYGASIKVGEHTMPAYIPHIGGAAEEGEVVYGARLKVRLPAKRVPDAVERWLRMYEAERNEGEEFIDFAARVGTGRFEEEIRDLSIPAEFNLENMLQFIDWSRRDPYKVDARRGRVRDLRPVSASRPIEVERVPHQAEPRSQASALTTAGASRSTRARSTPTSRDSAPPTRSPGRSRRSTRGCASPARSRRRAR